jgi:hypothetical protein
MEQRRATDAAVHAAQTRNRWLAWMSGTALVLVLGLAGTLAFWRLYPYVIVTYDQATFGIVESPKSAKQGGVLSYHYSFDKRMDVRGDVSKQFVDGIIFQAEKSLVTQRPLGRGHVHCEIPIPETLPPGVYKLRITATYQVNPIRTVTYVHDTEFFEVTAK